MAQRRLKDVGAVKTGSFSVAYDQLADYACGRGWTVGDDLSGEGLARSVPQDARTHGRSIRTNMAKAAVDLLIFGSIECSFSEGFVPQQGLDRGPLIKEAQSVLHRGPALDRAPSQITKFLVRDIAGEEIAISFQRSLQLRRVRSDPVKLREYRSLKGSGGWWRSDAAEEGADQHNEESLHPNPLRPPANCVRN